MAVKNRLSTTTRQIAHPRSLHRASPRQTSHGTVARMVPIRGNTRPVITDAQRTVRYFRRTRSPWKSLKPPSRRPSTLPAIWELSVATRVC